MEKEYETDLMDGRTDGYGFLGRLKRRSFFEFEQINILSIYILYLLLTIDLRSELNKTKWERGQVLDFILRSSFN